MGAIIAPVLVLVTIWSQERKVRWQMHLVYIDDSGDQRLESQIDLAARAWGVYAHSKNQLRYKISRSSLQPIA